MEKKEKIKSFKKFFFKKIILLNLKNSISLKHKVVFCKTCYIFSNFKGYFFYIYNGNSFRKILINQFFLSFKFGNFVFTKKPFKYLIKKKKR